MTRHIQTALLRLALPVLMPHINPARWWASLTPLERFDARFWLIASCYPLAMVMAYLVMSVFLTSRP